MNQELLDAVANYARAHANLDGLALTPVPGLRMMCLDQPGEKLESTYRPLVCLVLQGEKHLLAGRQEKLCGEGQAIIVSGLAGAAVANLHAAWTHKVVSMPSEATFWQRVPSKSSWKALAPAAAISAAMPYISLYLTAGVAILLGLHKVNPENLDQYTSRQWACLAVRGLATIVFAIFTSLFLCIPATVTQVRIEASLLPEEQDSIVPFDRTFGGKVVGQLLGGTGRIGFLDAWRSFNWEARRRLIKLYVKIGAIMAFAIFVVVHVLAFEVFGVMGPALGDYLAKALHEAQKGQ